MGRARAVTAVLASAAAVLAVVGVTSWVGRDGGGSAHHAASAHPAAPAAAPAHAAGPAAAATVEPVPLPLDCQPTSNPPPTEYGFVARLTAGRVSGPAVTIDPMTARICGIIRIVPGTGGCTAQGQLRVPADGVIFPDDLKATLTVVPGMHPKIPVTAQAQPVVVDIPCAGSSQNGLKLDLPLTVSGGAGAFGLSCNLTISGTAHSVITGDLFSGNYQGTVTLTGNNFHATPVTNSGAYCPGQLPQEVNTIAQLPSDDFGLAMAGVVSIYQR